jgi:hypothetical protein
MVWPSAQAEEIGPMLPVPSALIVVTSATGVPT